MTSPFQHISQSASADAWQRFRLTADQVERLVGMARALKLYVWQAEAQSPRAPYVLIRDQQRVLCLAEPSALSPSPFHADPQPYSVAFSESPDAICEMLAWLTPGADVAGHSVAAATEVTTAFTAILRNEEWASWLALECRVLRSVQSLSQLDLEGEPLFAALAATIRSTFAPDLCALKLESPADYWPGKLGDWTWLDASPQFRDVSPSLTPRLQRLLYRRERTMFVEDLAAAPDVIAAAENQSQPFGSCVLLPLVSGEKPVGSLMLFYERALTPLPVEMEAVELFRAELSSALDRSRVHLRMQRMATVDGLTNLFNHRFFHDQLRTEFQRARRYSNQMALIMVDIDNFKSYNDTYGHLAGDRVLAETARTIRDSVRDIDFVARYGGEEFALILPEVDARAGVIVAEKIRMAVEAQRFISDDGENIGSITISCGVTDNTDAVGPDDLISRADRALYWVKRHGRNLVRLSVAEDNE